MDEEQTHVKAHAVKNNNKNWSTEFFFYNKATHHNQLVLTQLATDNFSSSNE